MEYKKTVHRSTKVASPFRYDGNLFLLILCLIIWFPVGLLMLIKHGRMCSQKSSFNCYYHGSWGWLYFWAILFFPIAIVLLLIKGIDVIEEQVIEQAPIERL
jgi:hypothetical protein